MGVGERGSQTELRRTILNLFSLFLFGTSPEGEGGGGRGDNAAADDDGGM